MYWSDKNAESFQILQFIINLFAKIFQFDVHNTFFLRFFF